MNEEDVKLGFSVFYCLGRDLIKTNRINNVVVSESKGSR